jgi:hypothetical protein
MNFAGDQQAEEVVHTKQDYQAERLIRNMKMKKLHYKFMSSRVVLIPMVFMGLMLSYAKAEIVYPDLPVNAPTVGFDSFDISDWVSTNKPASGVPEISEWTRQNDPGDTMALSAESIDGDLVHFEFYGENMDGKGILTNGLIQRIDGRLAAVTLPDTLPENSFYLMWVQNEYGYGSPVGINQTDAWWCGPYISSTGAVLSVFGENMDLGDGLSQLYIDGYGWLTNNGTYNPYKVDFVVPSTLTNGTYTAYAHNGHGGKYGWSTNALEFRVQDPLDVKFENDGYPDANVKDPTTWYNYSGTQYSGDATGAVGDGVTDDFYSINECAEWIKTRDYSTMYFPAGTYLISEPIRLTEDYIRVRGDGMDLTKIQASSSFVADYTGSKTILQTWGDAIVEDLEINKGDITAYLYGSMSGGRENLILRRCRFSMLSDSASPDVSGFDTSMGVANAYCTQIIDCEFLISSGLGVHSMDQLFIRGCTFYGLGDINGMIPYTGEECCFENNYASPYSTNDTSSGTLWGKGRWMHGGGSINKVYIGDNVSSNMAPRIPTPFLRQSPIAVSELTWADSANSNDMWATAYQTFTFDNLMEQQTSSGGFSFGTNGVQKGDVDYHYISSWDTDTDEITVENLAIRLATPGDTNIECIAWDTVDANSGEQFLWEVTPTYYSGYPTTIVNFTNLYFSDLTRDIEDEDLLIVIDGKGMGQSVKIANSQDTSSGTVILTEPLKVGLDETSHCKIGRYINKVVLYNNNLNGTPVSATVDRTTATVGFNVYGGASRVIVDANRFSQMNEGVAIWSDGGDTDLPYMHPNVFSTVKNNQIDNCKKGIAINVMDWDVDSADEYTFFGHVLRGNTISNCAVSAFHDTLSEGRKRKDLCVYDRNVTADNAATFEADSVNNIANQVLVGNSFSQDGETGLTLTQSGSYILRGNTWTGFDRAYSGATVGWLEVPVSLINLKSGTGNLEIWNSGTAKMEWSATATSTWLMLTKSSGSIEDENSTDLLSFTMTTEPAVESQAVITVTAGEQSSVITLVYKGAGVVAVRSQTWPILFDSGGRALRAELYDVATEQTSYVYGLEVSKELQQPNPDREVKIRLQVQDGDQWINVENQGYK